jgi:hypothetical protein
MSKKLLETNDFKFEYEAQTSIHKRVMVRRLEGVAPVGFEMKLLFKLLGCRGILNKPLWWPEASRFQANFTAYFHQASGA